MSAVFMVIVVFFLSIGESTLLAQVDSIQTGEVINLGDVQSNAQREEVQRYFGYENLLFRYLTLPYDLSINTNQQVRFVDIGFVFLILCPIFFIHFFRHKKLIFYGLILGCIVYLSLCFNFSYVYDSSLGKLSYSDGSLQTYLENEELNWIESIHADLVFNLAKFSDLLIPDVLQDENSQKYLTYPLYFVLFLFILVWTMRTKRISSPNKLILIVLYSFSLLWAISAGGIIWYGFLMIVLGYVVLGIFMRPETSHMNDPFLKVCSLSVLAFWGILALTSRMSNINIGSPSNLDDIGKSIVDANLFYYTMGLLSGQQVMDNSFGNLSPALARVNGSEQLIYQVGTSFTYDIDNNDKRIFQDNTLTSFFTIFQKLRDPQAIIAALKASDFKYIIVDLNTYTLDKTPERSLETKFKLFLQTLYKNSSVSLISTDRLMEVTDAEGKQQQIYNVFGSKMIRPGSFAIYEIL